jgi:hypothetical protein
MAKILAIVIVSLMIGASLCDPDTDKWNAFRRKNGKHYGNKKEEDRRYI